MKLIVNGGNSANLFSDISYFMSKNDIDMFARTDYSLRLVQSDTDLWVAHYSADFQNLEATPGSAAKLDLALIVDALSLRDYVIIGGHNVEHPVHANQLIENLKYVACSMLSPTKAIDLQTSEQVDLKSPVSALMIVTKVPGIDTYVMYLNPMFLRVGGMFTSSPNIEIKEVYERPGTLDKVLLNPSFEDATVVKDVVMAAKTGFTLNVLPGYDAQQAETFLKDHCTVVTNLPYSIEGGAFKISSRSLGYFKAVFDLGFVGEFLAECRSLEYVVHNTNGAFA